MIFNWEELITDRKWHGYLRDDENELLEFVCLERVSRRDPWEAMFLSEYKGSRYSTVAIHTTDAEVAKKHVESVLFNLFWSEYGKRLEEAKKAKEIALWCRKEFNLDMEVL